MIKSFLVFALKVAGAMILVELLDSFTGIYSQIKSTIRGLIPTGKA